jgi:hypothetical protein
MHVSDGLELEVEFAFHPFFCSDYFSNSVLSIVFLISSFISTS